MPIRLTDSIVEPDKHGRTGRTSVEAKVVKVVIDHLQKHAVISVQYGTTSGGRWVPGTSELGVIVIENERGTAFDDLVADDRMPTMAAIYAAIEASTYDGTIEGQP